MLNIVVPMAGRGSRFQVAGYVDPKPLLPVHGVPMIELVIRNLSPTNRQHRFIFLALQEHLERFGLADRLSDWVPGSVVVPVDRVTEGAACTVLLARQWIENDDSLMIANCDQWIDFDIDRYLDAQAGLDGLIMTMQASGTKWSYVSVDEVGLVNAVAEKQPISDQATVGIYNFSRGKDFVGAADAMITARQMVNGEYYVAPVYQQFVDDGARVGVFNIGAVDAGMYGLGTPEDLERFLLTDVSRRAVDAERR